MSLILRVIASLILAFAAFAVHHNVGILDQLSPIENSLLDKHFQFRKSLTVEPKLLIIEIDPKSFDRTSEGAYETPTYIRLIEALRSLGTNIVVLDVPLNYSVGSQEEADLASRIKTAGGVYLAVTFIESIEATGSPSLVPSKLIRQSAAGVGHTQELYDGDGRIRRVSLFVKRDKQKILHLGLRSAMAYLNVPEEALEIDDQRVTIPEISGEDIELGMDKDNASILNWQGVWNKSIFRLSSSYVMDAYQSHMFEKDDTAFMDVFDDSICVIGISAPGFAKHVSTVYQSDYPAIGITATLINSIITRQTIRQAPSWTEPFILWLISSVFLMNLRPGHVRRGLVQLALIFILYTLTCWYLMNEKGLYVLAAYPAVFMGVCAISLMVFRLFSANQNKKNILEMVTRDDLTRLIKYEHFQTLLDTHIRRVKNNKSKTLSFIMGDVDHFKLVNDTYGHAAGDAILRGLSEIMRNHCRVNDIACRFGGEEFILMLPDVSRKEAISVADRMRQVIELRSFVLDKSGKECRVTVSFGVSSYHDEDTKETLFERIDRSLYRAKQGGRNMVCWE